MMQRNHAEAQPIVRSLSVGPRVLERNLILAPMAGVTNLPFRLIAREAGAALTFTETVSAKGLAAGGPKTWRLVESSPREEPLAYQLFGCEPEVLAEATRMLVGRGAGFIDLNLGCPVKKFVRNGSGAALLREPRRVAPLLAVMRRAIPDGVLSVKMRLGWNAESITAPEVARIAAAEGADFLSVHGRTRAQLYSGKVDGRRIQEVVDAVDIPVFANGDIIEAQQALDMLRATGAAGVMIGRGAMSNPWIFSQIVELAQGRPVAPLSSERREALVQRHMAMVIDYYRDSRQAVHMLKKYLCAYSSGIPGSGAFRMRINRSHDLDRVVEDASRFFQAAA
jgi:nifR3 family TIM-barrel protein